MALVAPASRRRLVSYEMFRFTFISSGPCDANGKGEKKIVLTFGIAYVIGFSMLTACGQAEAPKPSCTEKPTSQNDDSAKTKFANGVESYFMHVSGAHNFMMQHKTSAVVYYKLKH